MRGSLVAVALLLLVGCKPQVGSTLHSVEVADLVWDSHTDSSEWMLPEQIILALDIENNGAVALLRSGRMRVSYRGRRVAMFTLSEKVRIARHSREQVLLPLKISVMRNSQSAALMEALRQHDVEHITIDWEVAGRSGIFSSRIVQPAESLNEIVQGEKLEYFWSIIDAMIADKR